MVPGQRHAAMQRSRTLWMLAIASFAAVSALFVLPTYPTLLAAVEMDDTGT